MTNRLLESAPASVHNPIHVGRPPNPRVETRVYNGERFNSISHLVGAVLALTGATVLVSLAGVSGGATRFASFAVYGLTLLLLYLFSTLYHSLRGPAKQVFQVLDHHAVYLLIAGIYTPFCLVALGGTTGSWLFGSVWGLALLGIVIDTLRGEGGRLLSVVIYLIMGWLILLALDPIIAALPATGFRLLVAGGIFYTVGVVCYALARVRPWCHGIWHLFVLAGSISHYFAILLYL
jgi:hemolysin III